MSASWLVVLLGLVAGSVLLARIRTPDDADGPGPDGPVVSGEWQDWSAIGGGIDRVALPPILAFGPHLDVDGLRDAKAAGVTRVVSNGTFHRDAATLIGRYASGDAPHRNGKPDDTMENL